MAQAAFSGRHSGRTIAQRGKANAVYRAKLKAREMFDNRRSGKWTREEVIERLNKLPEPEREMVRQALNELNANYVRVER